MFLFFWSGANEFGGIRESTAKGIFFSSQNDRRQGAKRDWG